MKWDFSQEDFSAGEVSDRAQGHFTSDIYRAALKRAANVVLGPTGSVGSRSGVEYVATTALDRGIIAPKLIPIEGGAREGLMLELGGDSTRILDKKGVVPWHEEFDVSVRRWIGGGGATNSLFWTDDRKEQLYLRNPLNVAAPTCQIGSIVPGVGPAGTTGQFVFNFTNSGSDVTLLIEKDDHTVQYVNSVVFAAGRHAVAFNPGANNFLIKFSLPGVAAANIWNMTLVKNAMKMSALTIPDGLHSDSWVDSNKNTCAQFWAGGNFYVVFVNRTRALGNGGFLYGYTYTPQPANNRTNPTWAVTAGAMFAQTVHGSVPATSVAAYQNRLWVGYEDGSVWASRSGYLGGGVFDFTVPGGAPLAANPMKLELETAAKKIAWMNALRGLLMGTTKQEMTFTMDAALAIDPATGLDFGVVEHGQSGSDTGLPAINVADKVVFFKRGRQQLRMTGYRVEPQGLNYENLGLLGEHLLRKRVRSFCVLRSPVERLVFAFDDGTGAIATVGGKAGLAWTRLTVRGQKIYSVAGNDVAEGTELWLSFESGVIGRIASLDSISPELPVKPYISETYDVRDISVIMDLFARSPLAFSTLGYAPGFYTISGPDADTLYALPDGTVVSVIVAGVLAQTGLDNNPLLTTLKTSGGTLTLAKANNGAMFAGMYFNADIPLGTTYADPVEGLVPLEARFGVVYDEHRARTLVQEGGNPAGTAQALKSRKVQMYARFVDSYMPLVNGRRVPERDAADPMNLVAGRITGDRRCTEMNFVRGATVDIVQDLPLRFEISAIFGGEQKNNL